MEISDVYHLSISSSEHDANPSIDGGHHTQHKPRIIYPNAPTEERNYNIPSATRKVIPVRFAKHVDVAGSRGSSVKDEVDKLSDDSPTRALYSMERDVDSHALPLLLSILKDKKPGFSMASLVNATTIDLMCKLFSREDYVSLAARLTDVSDAKNLLDFMLHLLHDSRLTTLNGIIDVKRRGRRFMLKVITKTPVLPESLNVTGIRIPAQRDYIGRGGFGHVFKAKLRGDIVALKVLYKVDNNVAFCREALMWRSLRHKFVLPFLGIYRNESMDQICLVSPYMKNGTLAQWRKKANPSVAEVEERMLEVAKGMGYIHSEGVIHGDLRGDNVLLDANLHVQIADFGLTRISEATNTGTSARHLNFAAPELFGYYEGDDSEGEEEEDPIKTQKSDVYAFGCLYYEIYYDAIPFAGKTDVQIMRLHSRGVHPPRLDSPPLSDRAWELIRTCWVREASKRPRIEFVREWMVVVSVVSTLGPAARHVDPESNKALARTSATTIRLAEPGAQSREMKYECAMCHQRFGVASSLTRHVRKCMQKAHPRMDVGATKKIAVSQSVFSTPAPAAQDSPYDAARGLESGAASPLNEPDVEEMRCKFRIIYGSKISSLLPEWRLRRWLRAL